MRGYFKMNRSLSYPSMNLYTNSSIRAAYLLNKKLKQKDEITPISSKIKIKSNDSDDFKLQESSQRVDEIKKVYSLNTLKNRLHSINAQNIDHQSIYLDYQNHSMDRSMNHLILALKTKG